MITNNLHLFSVPDGLDTEQVVSTYYLDSWRIHYTTSGKVLESFTVGSEEWQIIEFDHSVWFGQSGTTIFNLPYQLWHVATTELPTSGTHKQGLMECIRRWAKIVRGREIAQGLGESFSVRADCLTSEEYEKRAARAASALTPLDKLSPEVVTGFKTFLIELDKNEGGDK